MPLHPRAGCIPACLWSVICSCSLVTPPQSYMHLGPPYTVLYAAVAQFHPGGGCISVSLYSVSCRCKSILPQSWLHPNPPYAVLYAAIPQVHPRAGCIPVSLCSITCCRTSVVPPQSWPHYSPSLQCYMQTVSSHPTQELAAWRRPDSRHPAAL